MMTMPDQCDGEAGATDRSCPARGFEQPLRQAEVIGGVGGDEGGRDDQALAPWRALGAAPFVSSSLERK